MHKQNETRKLPVKLTVEELEVKSQELAAAVQHEAEERSDFDEWLDGMKTAKKMRENRLEAARLASIRLADIVKSGEETRDVPADWLHAISSRKAFLVRRDTGELVEERDLRGEELQVSIGEVLQEPTPEQLAAWLGDPGPEAEEMA